MNDLAKLRKHSIERKLKFSELFMGKNNPFYGKKHTVETINKISLSNSFIYLYNLF